MDYTKIWRIGIFSLFFFFDIISTYFAVIKYRQKFPKDKKWYKLEFNFLLKKCWKKWGINLGTFISVIIIYPFFFLAIYLLDELFFLGMLIGIYIMIFLTHFLNFRSLYEKKEE